MLKPTFHCLILSLLLLDLLAAGCRRGAGSSTAGNAGDGGGAAMLEAAAVAPRDPLVGLWKVSGVQAPGQLPPELASMVDTLKTNMVNFHADHTFRFFNADAGGYSGTWSSDGKTITLTKGRYQKDQYPATKTLALNGARLLDANDSYTTVYSELPADNGRPTKVAIADFLTVKDDATYKSKYFHKPVQVNGIVHGVNGFTGIVTLRDPGQPASDSGTTNYLQCYLTNYADYGKLATGQTVTLCGIAVGDSGSATIEDCQIITAGPSTAVTLAAAELAAQFVKDPDAAMQQYAPDSGPKTIFLTGPLLARNADNDPVPALFLGAADAKVHCTFTADDVKRLASLKPGDIVHVAGDLANDGSSMAGLENCYIVASQ